LSWKSALVNEKRGFGHKSPKRWSEEHSRGPKVWFTIQGNILGSSINKNTYHEGTGKRGTTKYLRENYYHCIEYSVANSLAVLMRK